MACMEAALKPSLRREMAASPGQYVAGEGQDWLAGSSAAAVGVGEEFSVDELLDFSNEELAGGADEEEEEEKDFLSFSSAEAGIDDDSNSNSGSFSCSGSSSDGSASILAGGLAVPADDIAELEWVSRFVDDSLSEFPIPYPTAKWKTEHNITSEIRFESVFLKPPRFPSPVPVKTRSKRSMTPSHSRESSSSASSCSIWSSSSMCLLTIPHEPEGLKRKKINKTTKNSAQTGSIMFQRRCSHCRVQKTPQWRTGPLGAKTLCNACGVRYKSGRLFPEYRPACSPTFSVEVHSNSHRKVLEMRRKKETAPDGYDIGRYIGSDREGKLLVPSSKA